MFKIIVIGFLCNVLTQSKVLGESMIKAQICKNVFEKVFCVCLNMARAAKVDCTYTRIQQDAYLQIRDISDSLNQIEPSVLREVIGDLQVQGPKRNGFGARWKGKSIVLSIRGVEFENVTCRIMSSISIAAKLQISIYYVYKGAPFSTKKKFNKQYANFYLNLDIFATFLLQAKQDKLSFYAQQCEVYLRVAENDESEETNLKLGQQNGSLKLRLCLVVVKMIQILNLNWKDSLIIDPSGDEKLVVKSVTHSTHECLEIKLDLVRNNFEITSEQRHSYSPETGIDILEDYINNMLSHEVHLTQLNKILHEMNLQLTPAQLNRLIPDVSETESINLNIIIYESPRLTLDNKNDMMTVFAELQGFSPKSDKSIFNVKFRTHLNAYLQLQRNKLKVHMSSTGAQEIYSVICNVGKSGTLDLENLQTLLKDISSEVILTVLNYLGLSARIPFWTLASNMSIKQNSVELSP